MRWAGEHPAFIVLTIAVAAAAWAVLGSHYVFPYLTDDHDEGLYLLQAEALAEGYLLPPAPKHPDAFIPWLTVLNDGIYVLKYAPVHASILALGIRALGDPRWSLGLIAGAVVVLTYALAKEVLGDRRQAVLASAFLALSPLFLLQSATFLSYCSSLLLLEAFAFTLLRGLRTRHRAVLAVSGLLFGLALFARPFDALIFGAPLVLYGVIRERGQLAVLGRPAAWFGLGVVLPVAAMLLYYRAATGSAFRPPFNLLEPSDTLGFGPRRLLPGQPALPFTPTLGWYGVSRHVLLTSFWGFGGLMLVGFFLFGLIRRRKGGTEAWIAAVAVTFACGYAFFWGTYGTSLKGGLTSFLGPFYFLPVLACVTILAARGFGEFWRRDWVMSVMSAGAMVLVSGYLLVTALQVNLRLSEEDRRLYAAVEAADLDGALVLVPPMWGRHLLHPFAWLQNDATYDGETVYALDLGEGANLDLLDVYPDRAAYRLHLHGAYRASPQDPGLSTSLERLTVLRAPAVEAELALENTTGYKDVSVSVTVRGRTDTFVLDTSSESGQRYGGRIRISAGAVEWQGPLETHVQEFATLDDFLTLSIAVAPGDGTPVQTVYQQRFGYDLDGTNVRLLMPGVIPVDELATSPFTVQAGS